jgi:hypothetical protein
VNKYAGGTVKAETFMIDNADHMYTGEEAQVAQVISEWIDRNIADLEQRVRSGSKPGRAGRFFVGFPRADASKAV